jgi:glycosyltransferase involved in cell wall biosynthesis
MAPSASVTVVVPTRDRLPFLRQAVRSALAQEEVPLEVVVVDDGSRDGTAAWLSEQQDDRLRVIKGERRGVSAARNAAIAVARGEWLAFLDDDDLWAPQRLAHQLEAALRTGAGVGYGARLIVDAHRRPLRIEEPVAPGLVAERLRRWNVLGGPSAVVARTEAVRRAGGFDVRYAALADWALWVRLAASERLAPCPQPLVAYTEHLGNMHQRGPWAVLREWERLLGATAGPEDRRAFARWVAEGLLDSGHRCTAARVLAQVALRTREPRDAARVAAALIGLLGRMYGRGPGPTAPPAWLAPYREPPGE